MSGRRPFVGGNWKMNNDRRGADALARAVAGGFDASLAHAIDGAVFPAAVHLDGVGRALNDAGSSLLLGAQNLWPEPDGAFTGEVSVSMLIDLGVDAVLTGHSERRHVVGETDDLINAKTVAALDAGLTCVLCVGETLGQREAGETDAVNEVQVRAGLRGVSGAHTGRLVVAYEPVWAIGTGRTATPDDAQSAHEQLRAVLTDVYDDRAASRVRIIYGGSVKPSNADELAACPDVDGFLVGGASLKADDFLSICRSAAGLPARGAPIEGTTHS